MLQTALVIVIIGLFLLVAVIFNSRSNEDCMLKGFWRAGSAFLRRTELKLLLMCLGDDESNWWQLHSSTRSGYILMVNDNGILINTPVKLHLSSGKSLNPTLTDERDYNVEIEWSVGGPYEFFPNQQSMKYYPELGKLVFYLNDKVYAEFYRDNETTDVNNMLPANIAMTSEGLDEEINTEEINTEEINTELLTEEPINTNTELLTEESESI
jgi:hypothetical protein